MKQKLLIGISVLVVLVILAFATKETKTGYSVTTKIQLEQPTLKLGEVKLDSLITISIPLQNTGKQPLLLAKIEKSNTTLVIDETAQYFPIDKPIEITLLYQPNKIGLVNESLIVYGNFPEQQLTIFITGKVVP
jgi:hypothetical protein